MKQDNSAVPKMQGPRCQECRDVGNLRQLGSRRKSNALMGLHRPNVPSQMGEGMFNGITDTWVGPVTVHVCSLAPPMCPLKPLLRKLNKNAPGPMRDHNARPAGNRPRRLSDSHRHSVKVDCRRMVTDFPPARFLARRVQVSRPADDCNPSPPNHLIGGSRWLTGRLDSGAHHLPWSPLADRSWKWSAFSSRHTDQSLPLRKGR